MGKAALLGLAAFIDKTMQICTLHTVILFYFYLLMVIQNKRIIHLTQFITNMKHLFLSLLIVCSLGLFSPHLFAQPVEVQLPLNGTAPVQTANSGILRDNGGTGNFTPGGFGSITISPNLATCPLTLTFTEFDLGLWDYLVIYDGQDTSNEPIGTYIGVQLPNNGEPIVSTTGSFTIEMYGDIVIFPPPPPANAGFTAIWEAGDSSTDATFTISDDNVPANTDVVFTPNNGNYDTYFWNFGDGTTSTEVMPVHNFLSSGSFTVFLTITNCEGGTGTYSTEVLVQEPPGISIVPNTGNDVTLAHGDSITYSYTITNNGSGDLVVNIEGANLISNKELQVLALINGADITQEYPSTLEAINNHFTDYQLTELSTTSATVLATALQNIDVLLIPEQETCNGASFGAFAPVLQTFAQNGGTIIVNGTNQQACIFNTGLFSGTYQNFYSGSLNVNLPNDPIMEGVNNPYNALAVTYYFDITNPDKVSLVKYNGYDVVAYRNIGLGRAILIGHDYRYKNADMEKIIANCVRTTKEMMAVNGGVDWLYISENELLLAPGQSVTIDLEFNATEVYGGFYTQNIVINSNDEANPQIVLPCSLTVTGTPSFAISQSSYNFGEVMENDTARFNIQIINPGTDSLKVFNLTFDNPAFTAVPATFSLYGGGTSQTVELRFVPTQIAPYTAIGTIQTNILNFFISVSGTGVGAPVTSVTPSAITATINAGTSTTLPLTLTNTGQGPLFYDIDTTYFQQQLKVLAYTLGSDPFAYPATIDAINSFFTDYQLTTTNTSNPTVLADLLNDVNVLLVPAITDFSVFNTFDSFQPALQNFVNGGGSVIFLGNFSWGDNPVLHSGFFDGFSSFNSGTSCNVLDTTHPIMQGVTNPYEAIGITPMQFFTPGIVSLVKQSGFEPTPSDVVAFRQVGSGKAIYIGHDFGSGTDVNGARILSNALKWIATGTILEWFDISATSGTVGYPDSQTLTVTLDATTLLGGTYTTQVVIHTNDPLAPMITVPVTLTVIGIPAIDLPVTSLNFGNVIIGNTKTLSVPVNNPGTDSLFVTVSSGLPQFVANPAVFTVPPLSSQTLEITFVPDEIALLNTQILLANNVNDLSISVTGFGQGAPIVGVTPPAVEVTLLAGSSTVQTVTVTNTGAGPLEFTSNGSANIPILAWTYQANSFNYTNMLNALAATGVSYTLTETNTENPAELAALLQNNRILLIPDQNWSFSNAVYAAMAPVFNDYAQNGGTVLYLGNQCDNCIIQTGLFGGFIWAFLFNNVVTVTNTSHPLSAGLGSSYTSSTSGLAYSFTNPDVVNLTDVFTGGSTLSYRMVGSGKAIYVGNTFADYSPAELTMLKNALLWGGAPPSWITLSPTEGTVEVGESLQVNINFDASGLLAGTYTFNFVLITNDPFNPLVIVPCTMTVLAFPQTAINAQPTYSCDGVVYFYDQTLNNPTSWSWDFGDGNTAGIQNPIHTYTENGVYTVTLETCNNLGCDEVVYENYITVDFASTYCDTIAMPFSGMQTVTGCNGVLQDSGGNQNYLAGSSGMVTIAPPGAIQIVLTFTEFNYLFDFDFGDQIIIYDGPDFNSPIIGIYTGNELPNGGIVVSSGGAITIQEVANGWLGTATGFTATWDCINVDTPPTPNFTYEVTNNCLGQIKFTDASGNYPASWSWDFGDGNTSTDEEPSHAYLQSGTYDVVLTACNVAGCNTITLPVTISGVLYVNFTVPQYVQIGQPVMFIDNTQNATYWQWNFGNGQTAVGQLANPVTFYNALGEYNVTLTVTDSNGCVRTGTQTITVVQDIGINNPSQTGGLKLYPNPATNAVTLQFELTSLPQTAQIALFDATGKQVYQQQLNASGLVTYTLPTDQFAKGLYWVAVTGAGSTLTQKLVLQ